MVRPTLPKYEIIENTLNKITKKPGTKATYRSNINLYFKLLNIKNPDNYFNNNRDYTKDLWNVAEKIENMPPKTQNTFISVVKRFLSRNDIEIKSREWEDIASRNELTRAYAIVDDVIPKPNQLKRLLQIADPKIKTLIQFLATAGCRIDEAVQLKLTDIDMDKRMVTIKPEISKTSKKRYTFFTEETKQILEMWMRERKRFIMNSFTKSIYKRNNLEDKGYNIKKSGDKWKVSKDGERLKKEDMVELEERLFPFTPQNATLCLVNLLEKVGEPFNQKDRNPRLKHPRYRYHFHSLRKFWFHSFQNTDANKNHIDFMGGHQSLLDRTYTDFLNNPERLKDTYDKFSSCLNIFETTPDLTETHKEIEKLRRDKEEMQKTLDEMKAQIMELRLEKLEQLNGLKK